jgi:cytochrome c2
MKNNILLAAFSILFFSACTSSASKYYEPTAANAEKANLPLETLIAGRTIYMERCGECHNLYKPSRYTAEEWPKYVNKMQGKAKITDDQKMNIIAYLTAETSN